MLLRKNGFSLVEMLVVIAVLSVLAAMLLPTVQKSVDAAWTMQCANQLKQIGSTFHLYANEYKGILPSRGAPAGTLHWIYACRPYLGDMFGAQYTSYGATRKPGAENLALCPAYDRAYQLIINASIGRPDINRTQYWEVITYDINYMLNYRNPYPTGAAFSAPLRVSGVARTSECVMMVEAGAHDPMFRWTSSESSSSFSVYYNPRHGDRVNNVRIDGSFRPEPFTACSAKGGMYYILYASPFDRHCWYSWGVDFAYPNTPLPAN